MGAVFSIPCVLSRYHPHSSSARSVLSSDGSKQKTYLEHLLAPLAFFGACGMGGIAVPAVDVRQFSLPAACFVLSLGLALLGIALDIYLIVTISPRRNGLITLRLKSNDALPIAFPLILVACSGTVLIFGIIAMVLYPYNLTTDDGPNLDASSWTRRYMVAACLGMAVLSSIGVVVCSERVARASDPRVQTDRQTQSGLGDSYALADQTPVPGLPPSLPLTSHRAGTSEPARGIPTHPPLERPPRVRYPAANARGMHSDSTERDLELAMRNRDTRLQ